MKLFEYVLILLTAIIIGAVAGNLSGCSVVIEDNVTVEVRDSTVTTEVSHVVSD